MQGAMIIQVSVFTWLEFHFIRENMKITEIPRAFTTRITFRYNKRDDLHEVAYFIGIAAIAVYMSIDLQDIHVDEWCCRGNRCLLVVGFLNEKNAKSLRSTFDQSCFTNVFYHSLNIGLLNKVSQDLTSAALATSPTLKQVHPD